MASSLRDEVVASQQQLPRRLRLPLVSGVNALVDRLTCTPPPPVVKKPPKPPHDHHGKPGDHGPHRHHGGDGGDGNGQ